MPAPTHRRIALLAAVVLCSCPVFAQEAPQPVLQLEGSPADSVLSLHLTLPEESFVDITISDMVGSMAAVPVFRVLDAGEHELRVSKAKLPPGKYIVFLALNHGRRRPVKSVAHYGDLDSPTTSAGEHELQQQILVFAGQEPTRALDASEEFFAAHPRSLGKAGVYHSILPVLAEQADSATVHAAIDSLVRYLPTAETYLHIAERVTSYPRTAVHFARRALDAVGDKPMPIRLDSRFKYGRALGMAQMRLGDFAGAETSLLGALQTHATLPPGNRWVRAQSGSEVLGILGDIRSETGDYEGALRYYEVAIRDVDTEIWDKLEQAYVQAYGSAAGYPEYRASLVDALPSASAVGTDPSGSMDMPFPAFELPGLDGEMVGSAKLKGTPSIITFWAYSCGSCFQEMKEIQKLLGQYRPGVIQALAVHTEFTPMLDEDDQMRYVRRALEQNNITYTIAFDEGWKLFRELNVQGTPTTFILDSQGVIRQKLVGNNGAALRRAVAQVLAD